MNQLNCVIVTMFCCLGVTEKGHGGFVSQTETKWDETACTLAQSDIICYDDGSCVVENGLEFLSNTNIPDNGVWIGFTKAWISYAYVGCNKVNAEVEYSVSTLGECRRRTGCQTFGIRNSTDGLRCKCASNSHVNSGTCRRKCKETDQYPCGDTADTTMFSIYTVENVPPSNHSQEKDKNCLLFYFAYGGQGHNFYWNSCNLGYYPTLLCSGTTYSDHNQMAQTYYNSNGKWAIAVDHCFVGKHFPATIQSIKNAQFTSTNAQDYWTGIIKKESIISLTYMLDNSTNLPVMYAYIEKINKTLNVRFANGGESRKSLCAGDGTSATTSTTTRETPQPTYPESTTTTVKSTKDGTSVTPLNTTRVTQPTNSESNTTPVQSTKDSTLHVTSAVTSTARVEISDTPRTVNAITTTKSYPVPEGKDQGGSTAGLAAGLSLSLALLFVVMIIMLLFLKRRGLLPKLCKHNDEKNNNTADTATEVSFVSISIGESTTNTMQDLTASNHSYFVLEKTFEVTNKEETDQYAEPDISDHDHHDLTKLSLKDTDNSCNTIDGKKASAKTGLTTLNNDYNKVDLHQTSEYDHIHLNGRPTKYDRQNENEYDISNNVIDGKHDKCYEDDSDTYNHLSEQDWKSSGTGEVYGMPNTDGDSGYDTSGALKHIRNTASKDRQPEYAVIKKKW